MLFNLLVMTASALFVGGDESRVLVKTLSGDVCCAGVSVICDGAAAPLAYNLVTSGDAQIIRTSPGDFSFVTVSPDADGLVAIAPGAFAYVVTSGDVVDDAKLPSVWIGVRTAPVPAALAAHVGDAGVMVANVVEGSPADAAGLRQYDIIVTYNGADIDEPSDLLGAIGDAGTKRVRISVLRGGKKNPLRIKAAKRAATPGNITFKYDEPADTIIDDLIKTRGGVLRMLPGGKLELKSLGDLKNLPDKLKAFGLFKDMKDGRFHAFNFDVLKDLQLDMDDFAFNLDELKQNLHGNVFKMFPNFDGDFSFQMKMQVDDDGETISITRGSDGKITIERTDEDGNTTKSIYDSDEEFEDDDPDAFERFGKGGVMRFNLGGMKGLHVLPNFQHRLKFQGQWKDQIEKALESLKGAKIQLRGLDDSDLTFGAKSQAVAIKLDDDGSIELTVSENGKRQTYSFDSKEEFEDSEPDLYERFKEFFE